jgi:thiol-disulfide isomerase/thioredoxin
MTAHAPAFASMLVVTTPGCSNCRAMAPLIDAAERRFASQVSVARLDAAADLGAARELGVMAVPTFIARHDGVEVARRTGRMSPDELDAMFEAAASGARGAPGATRADRVLRLGAAAALGVGGLATGTVALLAAAALVGLYGVWDLLTPHRRG